MKTIIHRNKKFLEPGEITPKTGRFEAVKAKNQPFLSFLEKRERCNRKSETKKQGYPSLLNMSIKLRSVFRLTSQIEDDATFNKQLSYTVVRLAPGLVSDLKRDTFNYSIFSRSG